MAEALTATLTRLGGWVRERIPDRAPFRSGPEGEAAIDDVPAWLTELRYWLDSLVAFIALEQAIILRNVRMVAGKNISRAFISCVRLYVIIDAHVYLYWVINRAMPGTISFLDYNAAAFALWQIFSTMTHRSVSPMIGATFNLTLNIRWINLFVADFVWESSKVILALVIVYGQFVLFPARSISPVNALPNIPLLLGLFLVAGLIGSGFGLILTSAKRRWPIVDATMEAMMWFLFVTSGIYDSYVQLPPIVGDYFRFNPVMVVIEYARVAFDKGYPVGDLNLVYPVIVALGLVALGLLLRHDRRPDGQT